MNRTFNRLIFAVSLGSLPVWAASSYTREDAVRIALENAPDIKTAEESLKSAESQVTAAYGNAFPTVDLSATYARTFGVKDVEKSNSISKMLDDAATKNEKLLAGVLDNLSYGMSAMSGYRCDTRGARTQSGAGAHETRSMVRRLRS